MKAHFLAWLAVFILAISGCSIQMDQPNAPSSTLQPGAPSILPSTEGSPQTNTVTTTQVPVTWAGLNLTGRLVYINGAYSGDSFGLQIRILNLVTGQVTTIFDAPKYSWIYYLTVSPDAKQLIMSYSPPSESGPAEQDLYSMPLDGSQPPQLLFTPPTAEDSYVEVEWSPDGRYIYFTHVNFQIPPATGQIYPLYEIYRMPYPAGKPEKVAEKAYWPRLSPDSSRIVYVSVDLFQRENKLFVANADGGAAHEVVLRGPAPPSIQDAPIFSADGQSIFFSAPVPTQSYQPNWFDRVTGVMIARAHSNLPSDWWSVPAAGGEIVKLTNIQSAGLFASRSPDGRHIASYSLNGIFIMQPDGSELTMLLPNDAAIPGTVSWIP
jgi:Tol biopolymer transport system component